VGGVVNTQKGPVIAIMHQYALLGEGHSIHAPSQLEWYGNDVNDKTIHVGGLQRIQTPGGYIIPLQFKDGLAYMDIRPYSDAEWGSLPHILLTDENEWDPSVLDHAYENGEHTILPANKQSEDEQFWYHLKTMLSGCGVLGKRKAYQYFERMRRDKICSGISEVSNSCGTTHRTNGE
jgi:hypothetical protein